jgi:hypothetical protein
MKSARPPLFAPLCCAVLFSGCSRQNNVLLGRVEARLGTYTVIVTDCYRTSVPRPQRLDDTPDGKPVYRFTPCRDADILIRGGALSVNGKFFGTLGSGDTVLVDHGRVSINDVEATVKPSGL